MSDATCWTLVEDAARGREPSRDAFARLYRPVVEYYLGARWRGRALAGEVDDAVQEVFVDLLKPGGALGRADRSRANFRAFLYGVARNVALRHEERAGRQGRVKLGLDDDARGMVADETSPSGAFDRAWAQAIMRAARARHGAIDKARDSEHSNAELLRLRFRDGLPIREIAAIWECEPAAVHRQYGRARREFAAALYDTVAMHVDGTPAQIQAECARLIALLA